VQVNQAHPLTRYHLQKIISTREGDLVAAKPPATLGELEGYALGTQYRLLRLQVPAPVMAVPSTWLLLRGKLM